MNVRVSSTPIGIMVKKLLILKRHCDELVCYSLASGSTRETKLILDETLSVLRGVSASERA